MNILMDTSTCLWALTDDPRLQKKARSILLDEQNEIYYSVASLWEIALMHKNNSARMSISATEFARYCEIAGYRKLHVTSRHIIALETLERLPSAPAYTDRFGSLILAQAKADAFMLLSHDHLHEYFNELCIYRM